MFSIFRPDRTIFRFACWRHFEKLMVLGFPKKSDTLNFTRSWNNSAARQLFFQHSLEPWLEDLYSKVLSYSSVVPILDNKSKLIQGLLLTNHPLETG